LIPRKKPDILIRSYAIDCKGRGTFMIYGHIGSMETENAYTEKIRKAMAILRETDVTDMHHGKYPLDGDNLILQINEITTGPKEEKKPEVHRKYIDVQYMVHGHELIGFYPDDRNGEVLEDLLKENDLLFYKEREDVNELMLPMTDGCYAIFFPEDVHRPGCQMRAPEAVKKIILKIKVDTL
jgi:YhcH/YjgK/YiaL family protein